MLPVAGAEAPPEGAGGTLKLDATAPVTEQPGDRIGRYKLWEKIGEGGFGVVYVAEQEEPVRRRVALKVIKLGMDTREVIARFEAERQALALMDHPNIARVLDAGATDAGRPYFVMELVRGIRITDYCDQHNLTTEDRLELFTQVCHAIQHAHQKGIIHRDIKPSNILVASHDGVSVPKVIDFGIAKATQGRLTDLTVYTELNQFMGTPAYMSPEQAELSGLDVDTRTDIYALGVLLYQLLTGQTPFDPKKLVESGLDEIRRTIREVEPPKPSTRLNSMLNADQTDVAKHRQTDSRKLTSLLRGDLDWIVMKALEKDRARRYETANGFVMDIKRFLADEPVLAAAPSAAYRFSKFARRNKTALGVAAAMGVILTAATIASTWLAVRATRAEELAHRNVIRATAAEELAQKRVIEVAAERDQKDQARQEAESMSTFLSEILRSPDPAKGGGRSTTVAESLDAATARLEKNPSIPPARRALLQAAIAKTYSSLGLYSEAIALQEKVLAYDRTALRPGNPDLIGAMFNLATYYHQNGRLGEALTLREEVLMRFREAQGPATHNTLASMANLATSYDAAGRREEALKLREEVLALRRQAKGPEDPDTLDEMTSLADSYTAAGRREEALKLREEEVMVRRKVQGLGRRDTRAAMKSVAESYQDAKRFVEAESLHRELLEYLRQHAATNKFDLAMALSGLGDCLLRQAKDVAAESCLRESLAMLEKQEPGVTPTFATQSLLGASLAGQSNYAPAEVLMLQAYAGLKKRDEQRPPSSRARPTMETVERIIQLYETWGKPEQATEWKQKLEAFDKARPGAPAPEKAGSGK